MKKLILLGVLGLLMSPAGFAQSQLAGDWQGSLDAGGSTFRVAWHVVVGTDGTLTSTLDNIDQSIYGIKAKSTTVKGLDITVTVDDVIQVNGQEIQLRGEMVGTVNQDATEMHGMWTQTEPEQPPAPLELKRTQQRRQPTSQRADVRACRRVRCDCMRKLYCFALVTPCTWRMTRRYEVRRGEPSSVTARMMCATPSPLQGTIGSHIG